MSTPTLNMSLFNLLLILGDQYLTIELRESVAVDISNGLKKLALDQVVAFQTTRILASR